MAAPRAQVLRVVDDVILDWGNGIRLRIGPAGPSRAGRGGAAAGAARLETRGRKPSPATQKLRAALEADAAARKVADRAHYLGILRDAGHKASATSANLILNREAKRVLGQGLPRSRSAAADGRGPGRQPSKETVLLRERLAADRAKGKEKDATAYLKWLVDQPGVKAGLKQLRPMVYRELRKTE